MPSMAISIPPLAEVLSNYLHYNREPDVLWRARSADQLDCARWLNSQLAAVPYLYQTRAVADTAAAALNDFMDRMRVDYRFADDGHRLRMAAFSTFDLQPAASQRMSLTTENTLAGPRPPQLYAAYDLPLAVDDVYHLEHWQQPVFRIRLDDGHNMWVTRCEPVGSAIDLMRLALALLQSKRSQLSWYDNVCLPMVDFTATPDLSGMGGVQTDATEGVIELAVPYQRNTVRFREADLPSTRDMSISSMTPPYSLSQHEIRSPFMGYLEPDDDSEQVTLAFYADTDSWVKMPSMQ